MITFNNKEELMEYLMTSEFSDGLTYDEQIYLLKSFRYYYRLQHSLLTNKDSEIGKLSNDIDRHKNSINILKTELDIKQASHERFKLRKLSIMERIKGKIL